MLRQELPLFGPFQAGHGGDRPQSDADVPDQRSYIRPATAFDVDDKRLYWFRWLYWFGGFVATSHSHSSGLCLFVVAHEFQVVDGDLPRWDVEVFRRLSLAAQLVQLLPVAFQGAKHGRYLLNSPRKLLQNLVDGSHLRNVRKGLSIHNTPRRIIIERSRLVPQRNLRPIRLTPHQILLQRFSAGSDAAHQHTGRERIECPTVSDLHPRTAFFCSDIRGVAGSGVRF
mmetsp:Transcript_56716/g.66289  ORF Transcript_56716/g.66289 Transcript_56716/m.66289 type:complete len:227 (-) Transcript_56716:359-1039(-)